MDIRTQIGEKIREARVAAGKSQPELAEHLGVSESSVSRLEAGRYGLPTDRLIIIARFLKINPARLLPKELPRGRRRVG